MTFGHDPVRDGPVPASLPGVDTGQEWSQAELVALIEALLLVANEPPAIAELAAVAGVTDDEIGVAVASLGGDKGRGWFVQQHGDRIHLATAPRFAPFLRRFLGLEREARLSPAALEVLAIVAYRQPVTRTEIEGVRGVDCSGVLATLHARSLIEAVSRRPTVGNPIQYGTSLDFLRHFGLRSLDDLPPIGTIDGEDGLRHLWAMSSDSDDDGPQDDVVLSETVRR